MDYKSVDRPLKIVKVVGSSFFISVCIWNFVLWPIYAGGRSGGVLGALIFCTAAAIAGLFLFVNGLAIYREFRLLLVTAETPIRALAMGFVEVHGKAVGDQTIISPVSKTPCGPLQEPERLPREDLFINRGGCFQQLEPRGSHGQCPS